MINSRARLVVALAAGAFALVPAAASAQEIEDQYIVVMESGASKTDVGQTKRTIQTEGGTVDQQFSSALKGFAAELDEQALEEVRQDPDVAFVEPDRKARVEQQASPPWGLDRIDQRDLPLNARYSTGTEGAGVAAYIIDTGINMAHTDFGGRAVSGFDAIDGGTADDCHGHGTHVAGTVGGKTYGVAKRAKLVAVRVADCSGYSSTSAGIAALDWITNDHQAGQPAAANISIAYQSSPAFDAALRRTVADGVTIAMSAGNSGFSTCEGRLSTLPEVLAVGATSSNDARAYFSNWGATCVDLFAPGDGIVSASYASSTGTATMSGTSMAAPHVAGAAALILGSNPQATPEAVRNQLIADATPNKVTNPGTGSPNRLLFTAATDGPWSGSGTATTTVSGNGTVLNYSVAGSSGNWTFSNTAKTARTQAIKYRYNGYHAWFNVRVAIERFVVRNGVEIAKQTLHSAGPVNCCAAPSGGFDYSGTATFDLQPGDVYGFRMSGSHFDSDRRLIGTLTLSS